MLSIGPLTFVRREGECWYRRGSRGSPFGVSPAYNSADTENNRTGNHNCTNCSSRQNSFKNHDILS